MNQKELTLRCLDGLSTGDGFGEYAFRFNAADFKERSLPPATWNWTDDTHMALSIVEILFKHGEINQDALAQRFAQRYSQEPWRGYGGGAHRLLSALSRGADWRKVAPRLFNGGSFGNGAAMRATPIGAYYTGNPQRAAEQADLSAAVTHHHPDGRAGAIAVAVGAALLSMPDPPVGAEFLRTVLEFVSTSGTRDGIIRAIDIPTDDYRKAALELGSGVEVAAFDTVPYCLWVAAHYSEDYPNALWITAAGRGDVDTTCAIVGGMVACRSAIPEEWLTRREPLPKNFSTVFE